MRVIHRILPVVALAAVLGAPALAQDSPKVYSSKDGVRVPEVMREVKPVYTAEAKKQGIQGSVLLDAVVLADGTVGEVRVTQSLDSHYGLDEQAVKALKQWLFKPGAKDGKPVAVRVDVEMTFTLK